MPSDDITKEDYKVLGMTCASCASSLESHLRSVEGVKQISVNLVNESVHLEYHTATCSFDKLQQRAKEIGYTIVGNNEESLSNEIEEKKLLVLRRKLFFSISFSIPVFVISMFFKGLLVYENWILMILSLPVLFWSGASFFTTAWNRLKYYSANMDTLVALSTGVAFLFSLFNTIYPSYFQSFGVPSYVYYESAVMIITLILLGRYLEAGAKTRTSSAIKALMSLTPKQVTVIRDQKEYTISIKQIEIHDIVVIKPGDKIPVDGRVQSGESFLDQSTVTGEPIPVAKSVGDHVYAGTINQNGAIRIIADKVGNDTLLSQVILSVREALASKPRIQKLVDSISGVFVPLVLSIATISFFVWFIYGPSPSFTYALLVFITVLIIACPCALGLATPTALTVGIGKGARQGILIKDAQSLESAFKVDTLLLDKTGTITEGKPVVTDLLWLDGCDSEMMAKVMLDMESQSEHPIAEAITKHLKRKVRPTILTKHFNSINGRGVIAQYLDQIYKIGNVELMKADNVQIPEELYHQAERCRSEAKTVVYFSKGKEVKAVVAVADKVRESSFEAIRQIHELGIDTHIVTGDNSETANAVAHQLGIHHVHADMMPTDKGEFIKKLQAEGKVVAMVGDGINDAYALAQSDVGIAMGSGTNIAMESAGITIMYADLMQVVKAIKLSSATILTIRHNLFWAFIYNLLAIPIAAGALYPYFGFLLNPMIAGAAMSMSSVSVLINSLRLKNRLL